MQKKGLVTSTGFALFSMFFGSGNLVFPIAVGLQSEGHYLFAALGILCTGVLVPFLGVIGMMLYRGDLPHFFRFFGKKGIFLFSFLALALMGPFGVLARCLTVAHGALQLLLPSISLPVTSLCLCLIIYLLTIKKTQIISLLGTVLTPFLLGAIILIAFYGLYAGSMLPSSPNGEWKALANGFFQGYQTMDLLAAFFFSQFVIRHLYATSSTEGDGERDVRKIFYKASLVGATLLSCVYVALILLGWLYAPLLTGQPPQEMLGIIAMESLGALAAPAVCLAVVFACLTTAVVLTSLFGEFLRTEIAQNKMGHSLSLVITLLIGFFVSTWEFAGIAQFLGPILETVYPALIVLTLVNIAYRRVEQRT